MPDMLVTPEHGARSRQDADRDSRTQRIVAAAKKTFGDEQKATCWLERPTTALAGMSPMALLDSDEGAQRVVDLLGRIDHGLAV